VGDVGGASLGGTLVKVTGFGGLLGGGSVAIGPGSDDPFGPKAVRASMGAVFGVGLTKVDDVGALPGVKVALVPGEGVPLPELVGQTSIWTTHGARATAVTGLIGAADLAKMKRSAILVNTARGPIVDEAALIAALKSRAIAHAGLDVYDMEPLPADHPLTKLDNVTLIPHLGYVVEDSYRHFYAGTIKDIEAWLDGKPINVLNPDALKK